MRRGLFFGGALLLLATAAVIWAPHRTAAETGPANTAQFDQDGKLVRPEGYRRWVYLSSGFGMSYSAGANGNPQFTNVFVNPAAYDYFLAKGKWPDKAIFVLEEY